MAGSQEPEAAQGHLLSAAVSSQPAVTHTPPHTSEDNDIMTCLIACNRNEKQILCKYGIFDLITLNIPEDIQCPVTIKSHSYYHQDYFVNKTRL